ncbi:unnamed protein product [Linum trigynum]|uniref:Pentatricopeptide repeat-containing protein n=1 Tax=Linum trigynum TaxID=586398 RepID=A0AAV2G771_9ROSI
MRKLSSFSSRRSLYLLNLKIRDATNRGLYKQTLDLYSSILQSGVGGGSNLTYPMVLKACSSSLDAIHIGTMLHSHVTHLGFQEDVYVQTSLLDMYSNCGDLVSSRKVFDEMSERGIVSWNSMIALFHCSLVDESFSLVNQMRALVMDPSSTIFLVLFPACSSLLLGLST